MIPRRGEYGLDGHYPRLGLVVQAALEAAAATVTVRAVRRGRPALAAASGAATVGLAALTAGGLYSTRRGKFEVWTEILDELGLRGDEHVLDIGCGRGAVLLLAAERVPGGRAVGADIWLSRDQSGNSRASTERNAVLEGVSDRVELVHADARELPFDPGTFDVVVSSLVFHNIEGDDGRDRAVCEAVRVLRPGGQLRIVDFLADRYIEPLQNAGCRDARVRRLGWRMGFGIPGNVTGLVSAARELAEDEEVPGDAGQGERVASVGGLRGEASQGCRRQSGGRHPGRHRPSGRHAGAAAGAVLLRRATRAGLRGRPVGRASRAGSLGPGRAIARSRARQHI
jgi:arsenite methyltransferase